MPRRQDLTRVAQEALCITSGMERISFAGGSQRNGDKRPKWFLGPTTHRGRV